MVFAGFSRVVAIEMNCNQKPTMLYFYRCLLAKAVAIRDRFAVTRIIPLLEKEGSIMKRTLCLVLMLALLLCALPARAASWTCPSCHQSSSGNFCSNCGTKKPADSGDYWECEGCGELTTGNFCANCGAARGTYSGATANDHISIQSVTANADGTTTIRWTADYDNPIGYSVSYRCESRPNSVRYFAGDTSGNSFTLNALIPGETYSIIVQDAVSWDNEGHMVLEAGPNRPDFEVYTVPRARNFDGPNITIRYSSLRYRTKQQSDWNDLRKLSNKSVSFIESTMTDKNDFWLVTRFGLPKFKNRVHYKLLTAVYAPNDALYSTAYDIYFDATCVWHEWMSMYMNYVFSHMKNNLGGVAAGRYIVKTYLDYEYVGDDYFDIDR